MKRILVIGAGLGGLAAAIRLARAGHAVEVWEKNEAPGGKLRELRHDGFSWGTGPSILTMPQVLRDLFANADERLEDYLTLVRLDSCCRYFWTDGTVIDEDAAFWRRPEVARFLDYARGIYELSGEAYLNRPPSEFWRAFSPRNLGKLRHLRKVATTRTLAREVERRISDPHLRQIFLRFATYNGSSPYRTPATFNIIPFVEAEFGGWYVRGGLPEISRALARLAEKLGVIFRYNTTAVAWRDGEATAHDGHTTRADVLVCNGDAITARTGFLPATPRAQKRLLAPSPLPASSSFSAFGGAIRDLIITTFFSRTIIRASSRRSTSRASRQPNRRSISPSAHVTIPTVRRRITIIISSWETCPRAIRRSPGARAKRGDSATG
jgi:phytoene desaturase